MSNKIVLGNVKGKDGKSAYQAAVDKGYTGSEEEFNTALAGMKDAPFLSQKGGEMVGNIEFPSTDIGIFFDGDIESGVYIVHQGTGAVRVQCSYMNVISPAGTGGRIIGLTANPVTDSDATSKGYVDGLIGKVNSVLDAINGEVI